MDNRNASYKCGQEWARKAIGDDFTCQEAFNHWYCKRFSKDIDTDRQDFTDGWLSVCNQLVGDDNDNQS